MHHPVNHNRSNVAVGPQFPASYNFAQGRNIQPGLFPRPLRLFLTFCGRESVLATVDLIPQADLLVHPVRQLLLPVYRILIAFKK